MSSNNYIDWLEAYRNGSLSDEQRHELERAALDDPMLFDALEGYSIHGGQMDHSNLSQIRKEMEPAKVRRIRPAWWMAAASLLVLITTGILMRNTVKNDTASYAHVEKQNTDKEYQAPMANQMPSENVDKQDKEQILSKTSVQSGRSNEDISQFESTSTDEVSGEAREALAKSELEEDIAEEFVVDQEVLGDEGENIAATNATKMAAKAKRSTPRKLPAEMSARANKLQRISGTIKNNLGERIAGAKVSIENTGFVVVSDELGMYDLPYYSDGHKLVISHEQYQSESLVLSDKEAYNVTMQPKHDSSKSSNDKGLVFAGMDKAYPSMGEDALKLFIRENIKYPLDIFGVAAESKVEVSFNVNEDGTLSHFVDENPYCEACFEEAVRLLKASGKWETKPKNKRYRTSHTIKF